MYNFCSTRENWPRNTHAAQRNQKHPLMVHPIAAHPLTGLTLTRQLQPASSDAADNPQNERLLLLLLLRRRARHTREPRGTTTTTTTIGGRALSATVQVEVCRRKAAGQAPEAVRQQGAVCTHRLAAAV
jgi:hypothetical protein